MKNKNFLKRQTDFESFDKSVAGIVDADKSEQKPETDDEIIVSDVFLFHQMPFKLQVEVTWPDETQHGAGKTAD